jgi:hypothetical protein
MAHARSHDFCDGIVSENVLKNIFLAHCQLNADVKDINCYESSSDSSSGGRSS